MNRIRICVVTLLMTILFGANVSFAADTAKNENIWKPRTKNVAVFKNGLGFFVQEGKVRLKDGWCRGAEVPPASYGTFAVYSTEENTAVDIIALSPGEIMEFDDRQFADTKEARLECLASCKELNLQLSYTQKGNPASSAGKLISIGEEYVILENANSSFAVPLTSITKIQVLELPLRVHVDRETPDGEQAGPCNEEVSLNMSYLLKGIIWVPEYSLKIIDETTAELTLRGTLYNEVEDLIDTDVHLVVGVPHFLHAEMESPFMAGHAVRNLSMNLSGVMEGNRAKIPSQVMSQLSNSMRNNEARLDDDFDGDRMEVERRRSIPSVIGQLPQADNAGGSDYTVYTRKNLTLRRGERAMLTLFTKRIQYSHIYRWNTTGKMEHSLVLKNDTDTAWTTGSCMATSGYQPLSEDILKYVPRNGDGELQLTESINISQGLTEKESDRELKAYTVNQNSSNQTSFDLVTLTGKIKLQNYEPRETEIVITCPFLGKGLTASDGGEIMQDAQQLQLMERRGVVKWRIKLQPNEVKELEYTYERYVKSL